MDGSKKSLLEQLYRGELFPGELEPDGPEYIALRQKQTQEIDYLAGRLPEEDRTRFEELIMLMDDAADIGRFANYNNGLRTGIRLMVELFAN